MKKDKNIVSYTIIGDATTHIEGTLTSGSNCKVSGRIDGDIKGGNNTVFITDDCTVNGNITCSVLIIDGNVRGDVDASCVTITANGHIIGDITTNRLIVCDGGRFNGKSDMAGSREQEAN